MAQQQPELDLKTSVDVSRETSSTAPTPIRILVDSDGVVRTTNDAARRFLRNGTAEPAIRLATLVHPDDRSQVADWLAQVKADASSVPGGEFRLLTPSGAHRAIRGLFVPAQLEGELGYCLAGFDVTEQAARNGELLATEARFNDLLENATDLIYTTDLDGNVLTVNRACERVLGYTPAEATKLNISNIIPAEQLAQVRETVIQKLSGVSVPVYETDVITRSGERIAVEISSHLLYKDGRPSGLQGIARVITDRKRAAQALRSSQERFEKAFAAGPMAMLLARLSDGVILDANYSALNFYGYEREQLVGRTTLELNIWPSADVRTKAVEALMSQGSLREYPVELNSRGGIPRHLILSAELITLDEELCALWVSYDVSERKLAEDALRRSEERYSLATRAGRTGVWDVSLSELSIFVDPTLVSLLGYRTAAGIEEASFWRDVVHPDDLPAVILAVQANITGATANFEFEHRARHGSGEWRWMYTRGYVLRDEAGIPRRLVGTATDITERKLAQDGLRESEERYRTFIENTMEAVWRLELEQPIPVDRPVEEQIEVFYESARLAECNDAMAQMYGYQKASEIIGAPLSDFLARSESYTVKLLRAFVQCGYRLTEIESREIDRFGDAKFFVNNFVGIVEDGHLVRTWGTQRDVTRQKQAEALLHGQQRILELIATGASLNEVLGALIGFVEAQRPGLSGSVLLLSSDGERLQLGVAPSLPDRFNQAVDGMQVGPYAGCCGTAVYRREPVVIADISTDPLCSDWTWITDEFGLRSIWSSPIFSSSGQVLGTFALYRKVRAVPDTHERELVSIATRLASLAIEHHLAERALRVSEQRFSKAFSASPNAMSVISGRDGVFLDVNDAFCEVSGYDRDELLGRTVRELGLVPDPVDLESVTRDLTEHIPVRNREVMGRTKQGELRAQLISLETVELNGEKCLLCATTDIMERHRAEAALRDSEERLRQSQKLEAIGRLAGGVAHDFNNILTGIIGYSDMTLHRMKPDEPLRRNLQEIRRAADRAAELTHQLLAYSRRQILQPTLLDLNAIVLELDQMLRRLIGEDIVLRTNLGELSGRIKADRGQLEQVVMNLAVNARDAMPKGGSLTLTTGDVDLSEDQLHGAFKVPAGNYVLLSVLDTGTGMTSDIQAQIFEPFFTTKEVGKGTGLGLATVYGIVKQSGGNITVESEPGRGARFNIYLPRVVETEIEIQLDRETEVPTGHETVLLIEDDVTVRALAREILEMSGYRVLEAHSGDDALQISRSDEPIDLLLTDVVMPDYSGRELADRITTMRPALRVLYMSGYTDDAIVHHGVLEEGLNFIPKPFSPETLARKVRVVLDLE